MPHSTTATLWTRTMQKMPLVAILRGLRFDEALSVGDELEAAGFAIVEVPLNSPDPFATIAALAARFGDRMMVGAGTVLSRDDVDEVAVSGGRLIVSPNFNPEVVRHAKERGLTVLPGVMTPSEAFAALEAGADGLKLFPGEMISPAAVKAMRAVLPRETKVLVVGGVKADGMADYVHAGADGFGLGSALFQPGLSAQAVRQSAEAFVAKAREIGLAPSKISSHISAGAGA